MTGALLVTGANGLLGACCIETLANDADRPVIGVWHQGRERLLVHSPAHLSYERCNLADPGEVRNLFFKKNINTVLHTAARLPDQAPNYEARAVRDNILATVNLVAAAQEAGCVRFVYCSTVGVYGTSLDPEKQFSEEDATNPEDSYSWSKLVGESYVQLHCRQHDMTGISLRLSGLHGPGRRGGVIYHLMEAALSGSALRVNTACMPFQFLLLKDAVNTIRHVLNPSQVDTSDYSVVNVASAIVPSLPELARKVLEITKKDIPIQKVQAADPPLCQLMASQRLEAWPGWKSSGVDEAVLAMHNWLKKS